MIVPSNVTGSRVQTIMTKFVTRRISIGPPPPSSSTTSVPICRNRNSILLVTAGKLFRLKSTISPVIRFWDGNRIHERGKIIECRCVQADYLGAQRRRFKLDRDNNSNSTDAMVLSMLKPKLK